MLPSFLYKKKAGISSCFFFKLFSNYLASTVTGTSLRSPKVKIPSAPFIATSFPASSAYLSPEAEKLESAYYESLKLAKEKGLRKIAFPSVSTGIYRFPVNEGAEIALSTAKKFIDENPDSFDLILWVLDEKTYVVYKEKYEKLIKE